MIVAQIGYTINPLKEYKIRPERFKLEYQELKVLTADQYELNTWIMEPIGEQHKNVTIVIVGSDAGNMGFSLPYAYYLLNAGYRVVTFDYRGFGDSTDFEFNPNNVYHSEYVTDFIAVMTWSREEFGTDKIGVLGFSMGTLISAVGHHDSKYDFYIGEGFLRSPVINRKRVLELKNIELSLPITVSEDVRKIEDLDIPLLLFSGTKDQITTIDDSREYCNTRETSRMVEFDGEHLRGAATMGMETYVKEIDIFINSN